MEALPPRDACIRHAQCSQTRQRNSIPAARHYVEKDRQQTYLPEMTGICSTRESVADPLSRPTPLVCS